MSGIQYQRVEGLKDLEKALMKFGKHTTRKGVGRRVLKKAGQPLADRMNELAPDDESTEGGLNTSYDVSTRLNKRQTRAQRKLGKDDVMVFVGTNDPAGLQQEFGNINHSPQPHVRPAWDSGKGEALNTIKRELAVEIDKTAKREARRKARAGR